MILTKKYKNFEEWEKYPIPEEICYLENVHNLSIWPDHMRINRPSINKMRILFGGFGLENHTPCFLLQPIDNRALSKIVAFRKVDDALFLLPHGTNSIFLLVNFMSQ